jgi:hypothetical protein
MVEQLYEDKWGEVFDRPPVDLIELRWFDSTEAMSSEEFNEWLTTFAGCVEKCRRGSALVDSTSFLMNPTNLDAPWRDQHIIPRYNSAGVRRFAFHMPKGMPLIGTPPAVEEPGTFPTGYFGSRQAALDWLAGQD